MSNSVTVAVRVPREIRQLLEEKVALGDFPSLTALPRAGAAAASWDSRFQSKTLVRQNTSLVAATASFSDTDRADDSPGLVLGLAADSSQPGRCTLSQELLVGCLPARNSLATSQALGRINPLCKAVPVAGGRAPSWCPQDAQ